MSQPNPLLVKCANSKGLSGGLLFAMDTLSKPGVTICHFVRFETVEFTDSEGFSKTTFNILHPDSDPRVDLLGSCVQK